MSELRSKLIRLAFSNPELRGGILPLLRQARQWHGQAVIERSGSPDGLRWAAALDLAEDAFVVGRGITLLNGGITEPVGSPDKAASDAEREGQREADRDTAQREADIHVKVALVHWKDLDQWSGLWGLIEVPWND